MGVQQINLQMQENSLSEVCEKCRITESFKLEKTFKTIESNHKPNTAKSTTKPCP